MNQILNPICFCIFLCIYIYGTPPKPRFHYFTMIFTIVYDIECMVINCSKLRYNYNNEWSVQWSVHEYIFSFKYLFCNFTSPRPLENFICDASFDLAVTSFVQNVLMKPFKRQFTTAHLLWKLWRPRSHVLWLRQSQRRARTWRWHRVAGTWSLRTIFGSALENLYMVKPASLTSLALTKPSSAHCTHDVSFPSTSISRA